MIAPASPLQVTAHLNASTSVQELSKIFEGFQSLHKEGEILFLIKPASTATCPRVLHLVLKCPQRGRRSIAIDVADDPGDPSSDLLESVDVYFKRSKRAQISERLDKRLARKILPFGLNNPAISLRAALRLLAARRRAGVSPQSLARDARQLLALPSPRAFEVPPEAAAEPMVLFQTRLWGPETKDPDRCEINEERATLIQTLRSHFRHRFVGGAIPTNFVRAHYPDLVTHERFSMRAYPSLLKRPLVAVYSRGLRDSIAFKMSEYLAASRCIVGHSTTGELPCPIENKTHYLGFETPEECVARCDQLLSSPEDAREMRRANWNYYQANVEPGAHMRSLIKRAFDR